ncbi:predicted protein, partial [Nematostella vectensis]
MVYCYCGILVFLWKRTEGSRFPSASVRSKRKAVRLLILVVASFLLSWGPILTHDLLQSFKFRKMFKLKNLPLRPIFHCLCFTSSVINPVLYATGSANFNRSVRELFRVKCCLDGRKVGDRR